MYHKVKLDDLVKKALKQFETHMTVDGRRECLKFESVCGSITIYI